MSVLIHLTRPRSVLLSAALAVSALATVITVPHAAHAAAGCRSDPYLYMSTGVEIHVGVTVNDTASDVSLIQYTVHTPKGVGVRVVYPAGDPLATHERFIVQQDNPSGHFTVYSILQTYTPNQTYSLYLTNVTTNQQTSTAGSTGQTVRLDAQG